jgi:AraC-like DNA-binding protein
MKDYFVYLPSQTASSIFGCVTTGAGYTEITAGSLYPPRQHPLDHHFQWNQGRVLQCYQIIWISAGSGKFECEAMRGVQAVEAGTLLILFPGIWHRYRPADTGWVEHWLECVGPVFDAAKNGGLISPEKAVLRPGMVHLLNDCFERIHGFAQVDAVANQDLLSTLGLHLLAMLGFACRGERGFTKAIDDVVQRAHTLIALRCQEPLHLKSLANELGVGYSNLRHSFASRMGISLRQHYLNTRIQKSQDLLANTTKSIKEVAELLGFDSASHFSKQFKQLVGTAPQNWRVGFMTQQRQAR